MFQTGICRVLLSLVLAAAPVLGFPSLGFDGSTGSAEAKTASSSKTKANSRKGCKGRDLLAWLETADPEAAARVRPTDSEARNDGAVLYEIEKEGVRSSYLFGTVHLTDKRVTTLSKKVKKALQKSKILALEVAELSPNATADAVAGATDLVLFDDGRTLDGLLTADEFKIVSDRMRESDTPNHLARLFKPWVVSMIMAVSKCEQKKIARGGQVLDVKLAEMARKS
ncbi:MAG: TraB/GumN family protein, partial [Pseudomonadota bacterium]